MITLDRVRLVNWHYFRDETVPIGEFCLLSGDNASGKSTIIDAIQYVIASDLRKVRFNAAASNRGGGRDLAGYVRCKLGTDSTEYLRGDAVGHVMLRFTDGEGSFTAAACVEAWKDGRVSQRFWIASDLEPETVPVVSDSGEPLLGRQLQDLLVPRGASFYDSSAGFRRELTGRLGVWRRMSDANPYVEAFLRSLHFTPLVSVDQFVCDYILDEQTIDLSVMKQNLESYRQAEDLAKATRERIAALSGIIAAGEECQAFERVLLQQDWLKHALDRDRFVSLEGSARNEAERLRRRSEELDAERGDVEAKKLALTGEFRETQSALARSDAFQLSQSLNERLEVMDREKIELDRLLDQRRDTLTQCAVLYSALFPEESLDEGKLQAAVDRVEGERENLVAERQRKTDEASDLKDRLADSRRELADLEQGIRRLPPGPAALREALRAAGVEAWILCDLAEVQDQTWSDAVEGWLNTLRFACIVESENFPRALKIYDSLPRSVAGVPLPDISRMTSDIPKGSESLSRPGSLARLVTTENPWARTYLDSVLGDVMTADLEGLRRYSKAVTRECMSWSRHTATRIREEVYRESWLGAAARERRRVTLIAEIEDLSAAQGRLVSCLARIEESLAACRSLSRYLSEADRLTPKLAERERLLADLEELRTRLESIDTASFRGLQSRLDELAALINGADRDLARLHTESGSVATSRAALAERLSTLTGELQRAETSFAEFRARHAEAEQDCERYVAERLKGQTPEEILKNFESARTGFKSRLEAGVRSFSEQINRFAARFSELLPADLAALPTIRAARDRLTASELPEYIEKIRRARMDAEREFKEHFIARLNELIEEAKESFSEINGTLKSLTFGRDQYRFTLTEKAERRGQIEVIRKTAEITEFENSLFDALVEGSDRDAANELFNRILTSNLESAELRNLCDYRTYFTYDIRVRDMQSTDPATGKNPEYSLSRVLKEKSGGEAQTPYYVAIAASFFRFFRDKSDTTVRLVAFDEAFDRLDDERIAKIIAFYRDLGLQIILSVPSEKLESIAPHMDTVNLVVRRGHRAKVVDFYDRSREGSPEHTPLEHGEIPGVNP